MVMSSRSLIGQSVGFCRLSTIRGKPTTHSSSFLVITVLGLHIMIWAGQLVPGVTENSPAGRGPIVSPPYSDGHCGSDQRSSIRLV